MFTSSKHNNLLFLQLIQIFACATGESEVCPKLILRNERQALNRRMRDTENYDWVTVNKITKEFELSTYSKDLGSWYVRVQYDVYEIEGQSDRQFYILHMYDKYEHVNGVRFSRGTITVSPNGSKLVSMPTPEKAAQSVTMCDNNVFEYVNEDCVYLWSYFQYCDFSLFKHFSSGKTSIVCNVPTRNSLSIRLTPTSSCPEQKARFLFNSGGGPCNNCPEVSEMIW